MATKTWKTVSVRLSEEEENALSILCEKREQKKHALVKELLFNELKPILEPGHIQEGEGLPMIGSHTFEYNPEKDNFTWQLDLGIHETHILADDIPFLFIENLHASIGLALEQRNKIMEKTSKKKTVVPKSLLKYKVR